MSTFKLLLSRVKMIAISLLFCQLDRGIMMNRPIHVLTKREKRDIPKEVSYGYKTYALL